MAPSTFRLGVDLGTSNTVSVLGWPDGRVRPLLFDGSPMLPSAVFARSTGLIVGRDAVHSARTEPEAYEPSPKRRVDEDRVLLGNREIPVVEVFAGIFRRVWMEAERTAGAAPEHTTLTCPASWGTRRRNVLVDAARLAGTGEPRLVAEPVAAAAYFMLGRQVAVPVGASVVIYDFGGGTFDASVVRRTRDGFVVLATEGLPDAVGLDIDSAVVGYLGASHGSADPQAWGRLAQPRSAEDRRARTQLWDDVRAAKEMLSRTASTGVHLPLLGVDAVLGREQLELLATPVIERTVGATVAALRDAGVEPAHLAGLFLVGGSSRMPLASTMLHRSLGVPPTVLDQPELAVAEGSLLTASLTEPSGAPDGSPAGSALWPAAGSPAAQPVGLSSPIAPAAYSSPPPGAYSGPPAPPRPPAPAYPAPSVPTVPVSAAPASGPPSYTATPVSAIPVSASPVSASPVFASPVSAAPAAGISWSGGAGGDADDEPTAFLPTRPPVGPLPGRPQQVTLPRRRPRAGMLVVVVAVLVFIVAAGAVTTANLVGHKSPEGGGSVGATHDNGAAGVAALPENTPTATATQTATATATATKSPTHAAPTTQKTTPSSTTTTKPPPVVHKSGSLQVPQTWLVDLDEVVLANGASDYWFHAVTATERYVEPQSATMAWVGKPAAPLAACQAASFSKNRVDIASLGAGDILCFRTDQGRLSVVKVNAPVGASPGTLDTMVTTYEP